MVAPLLLLRGAQTPGEPAHQRRTAPPVRKLGRGGEQHPRCARRARTSHSSVELERRPGPEGAALGPPAGWSRQSTPRHRPHGRPGPRCRLADPTCRSRSVPRVAALALRSPVGRWVGAGAGSYPTIGPFTYTQEIDLLPIPGKPFLSYRSATKHATEHRPLHAESGFLRLVDEDGSVELVLAQGSGLVEIAEGVVDGGELLLTSALIGRSSTAKDVAGTERRYRVEGDSLSYELAMEAVGEPMTHHLQARLTRR